MQSKVEVQNLFWSYQIVKPLVYPNLGHDRNAIFSRFFVIEALHGV